MRKINVIVAMGFVILLCLACSLVSASESVVVNGVPAKFASGTHNLQKTQPLTNIEPCNIDNCFLVNNISKMSSSDGAGYGGIHVTSNPTGALVYGWLTTQEWGYFGTTPYSFYDLDAGTYYIKVTKSGYVDEIGRVIVTAGYWTNMDVQLVPVTTPTPTPTQTPIPIPTITSISPSGGPPAGNTFVTIIGTSFVGASQLTFDGIQATNFTYFSDTKITAYTPAHAAGVVTVLVAATGGTGTGTYTYQTTPTPTPTPTPIPTPVASFNATPLSGTAPLTVTFTDTSTNTPNTWRWDFGDGSSSTSQNPTHIYTSAGTYTVKLTATNTAGSSTVLGYITVSSPIPTISTIGIYRTGNFYLASNNTNGGGSVNAFNYGMIGDVPVAGDWNGDGISTVGIFRNGIFYLATRNTPGGGTVNAYSYGQMGDKPIAGDWNGDGKTEVGFFRNGMFYLMSSTGGTYDSFNYGYGLTDDKPIAGDWNGDGKTEVGVFSNGWFYLRSSTGGTYNYFTYGQTGDAPVAGDWNKDGKTEVGVFHNGWFYLSTSTGGTYAQFNYGATGDEPVAGKWT